jgi:plastocyanin
MSVRALSGVRRPAVTASLACVLVLAVTLGTAMSGQTHQVMLIHEEGKSVVVPATVKVEPGDTVEFIVLGDSVAVFFPHRDFFDQGQNTFEAGEKTRGKLEVMHKQLGAAPPDRGEAWQEYWKDLGLPRELHYAVYSYRAHDFAEGHSSPVMLIEPPEDDG